MLGRIVKEGVLKVLREELEFELDKLYSITNYRHRDNREAFEKLEKRVKKLEEKLKESEE